MFLLLDFAAALVMSASGSRIGAGDESAAESDDSGDVDLPVFCPDYRAAFIVGNNAYSVEPLRVCVNDANSMSMLLQEHGYDVTLLTDATKGSIESAFTAFGENLIAKSDAGRQCQVLIHFCGHGYEVDGRNYLAPVDGDMPTARFNLLGA